MHSDQIHILDTFHQIDFEKINKHPNILIAANFWDRDRFEAAKVCYRFMRAVDDMVDEAKSRNGSLTEKHRHKLQTRVNNWLETIQNQNPTGNPFKKQLVRTVKQFRIPMWPMQRFARSMIYDLNHNGFSSLQTFIDYSEGASIAPSSIFMHLCGLQKQNNSYLPPAFDVKRAAMPCALFSYLVHIIRDFQQDQLENLNYFADDLLEKHHLCTENLRQFAEGTPVSAGFRNMIRDYLEVAEQYRLQTLQIIRELSPNLEPRYRLSLEIIYNLYLMVYERIDAENGTFTKEELNPTPEEIKERVYQVIMKCNDSFQSCN